MAGAEKTGLRLNKAHSEPWRKGGVQRVEEELK